MSSPASPLEQRFLEGVELQKRGENAAAERVLREVLGVDPNHQLARGWLSFALLAQGRLAEGFPLYEAWRPIVGAEGFAPDVGLPVWAGEDLQGKNVVVWGEEGYGDQIMYARFLPLLARAGAQVGFVCQAPLVRLFREGMGVVAIVAEGEVKLVGADFVAPSSRLPAVFLPRILAIPPAPYLKPPKPNVVEGLKVGVVSRGNPRNPNDAHRSLPAHAAAELLDLPGAVSIAPEDTGARDFWDTAGIIMGLELVISADTAVAHLAGALGKPCWLLLPAYATDWRWGRGRRDSAWYPSMRLFRQPEPGDWDSVVAEVKAAFRSR